MLCWILRQVKDAQKDILTRHTMRLDLVVAFATCLRYTPLTLAPAFERLAVSDYELLVSWTVPWKKRNVCFVVFNCTTKGCESAICILVALW